MKKMLLLVVMLVMVLSVFAETVILNDGQTMKGEIVGKKDDSIYLSSEGSIHLLTRDLVKQIKNDGDLTITRLTYKKKDFMNEGIETAKLTPLGEREEITYDKPVAVFALPPKGIDEMGEREFQLYLTQLQVNELNGIRKTQWKIWGTSIGISVVGVAIMFLVVGN